MLKRKLALSTMLVSSIIGCSSIAAEEISISGFASFVAGMTTNDEDSHLGFNDDIDFEQGSLLGLQFSKDLGEGWGVTTQLLSRGSEDWDIGVEWAFVSYETDNSRFLMGRQRAPFYLYSDFLDVSYAYHWITPPQGVYNYIPFDSIDGVGYLYNSTLGDFDSSLHMTYGRNTEPFSLGGEEITPDFGNFASVSWTLNKDWMTIRFSYARSDIDAPSEGLAQLAAGWTAAGFASVGDSILLADDDGSFLGVSFMADYEEFLFVSEYTFVEADQTLLAENDSFYASFGYRTDYGMWHLTYEMDESDPDLGRFDGVPLGVDPGLDFLYGASLATVQGQDEDSDSITLGFKKDFDTTVSLKVEYTMFDNNLSTNVSRDLIRVALVTVF